MIKRRVYAWSMDPHPSREDFSCSTREPGAPFAPIPESEYKVKYNIQQEYIKKSTSNKLK